MSDCRDTDELGEGAVDDGQAYGNLTNAQKQARLIKAARQKVLRDNETQNLIIAGRGKFKCSAI